MGRGVTPSNGIFPTMQDMLNSRVGTVGRGSMQRNSKALMARAQQAANEATKKQAARAHSEEKRAEDRERTRGGNSKTLQATLTRFTKTLNSYSLMKPRKNTFSFSDYLAYGSPNETGLQKEGDSSVIKVNLIR